MITKYRIGGNFREAEIKMVTFDRETPNWLFLGSCRKAKISRHEEFYDTWEAAHIALTEKANSRLADARRALEHAQGFAGNVKGMINWKEPL